MLKRLTKDEYARRAADCTRVAVFREYLADRETPVAALSRLDPGEDAFLLESVSGGEARGRYSFLGLEPSATFSGDDALARLKDHLGSIRYRAAPELPPFQGGAVGYVAYDAVALFEPKVRPGREEGVPPANFMLCENFLVFDNVRGTVTVATIADTSDPDAYEKALARIDGIYARTLSAESIARTVERDAGMRKPSPRTGGGFEPEMSREQFREIVARCKEAIRSGEVIQIVPSQKFTAKSGASALSLYRALRSVNPSPYNFFLKSGAKTLIGSSPEELVKLSGRTASTSPIAGTRPRGGTPAEDAALERELRNDEKENAEHIMLVDLGRNDLGRVCETGSVRVEDLKRVERYSHVMHLVSSVKGELRPGLDGFDLLGAAFPAGTLSGAPKVRAMQLIAEYEKSPRGIYGGAAGYFSFTGDADFAIVIRTLAKDGDTLTMRSGAGIVADSDADREYNETVNKAKAVFEAVAFAEELQ